MGLHLQFSRKAWQKLLSEHSSIRSIARALEVPHSSVSRALLLHGLHVPILKPQARKIDYQAVFEHYQHTKNYVYTAQVFGISKKSVAKVCKEFAASPGRGICQKKNNYSLPMDEIIDRYKKGETCQEIAQDFAVGSEVIRRRLVRRGFQMRSVGSRSHDKNSQWNGGKVRQEYHYEARKVARIALGRQLQQDEVVHHHSENALDNTLENLWIFPNSASHSRYHGKLRALRNQEIEVDATHLARENGAVPLLELASQNEASLDKDLPVPSQMQA